jgi:hypothetical protein
MYYNWVVNCDTATKQEDRGLEYDFKRIHNTNKYWSGVNGK